MNKTHVKGTRVKSAGLSPTPVKNAKSMPDATEVKGTRVKPKAEMARKGDSPKTGMKAMMQKLGLKMSTRITK